MSMNRGGGDGLEHRLGLGLGLGLLRRRREDRLEFDFRLRGKDGLTFGHHIELADQILVVAFRLGFILLDIRQDHLDAVDGGQDQRHRRRRHRQFAIAELAQHVLAGMGHMLEARQTQESASALNGMDQTEDVGENLWFGILLELHKLHIQDSKAFRRFRQEFT